MTITLEEAMGRIATVQMALVANGYNVGTFGPCGDGVDGRWGPASRSAWDAHLITLGLSSATPEALQQLGVVEVTLAGLDEAIGVWNQFRNNMISSGTGPGTAEYEMATNAALASATGITETTCPGMVPEPEVVPPPNGVPPGNGMVPAVATTDGKGFPWWIVGVIAVAVVGGGLAVWWFTKERKTRGGMRRPKKAAAMSGWGRGPDITDEELGGGYEGYGQLPSGQEDEEGT